MTIQTTSPVSQQQASRERIAVELGGVARSYRDRRGVPVPALDGVSLCVRSGEVLAVVGPSGCGKTTLLELICSLQRPDAGNLASRPAVLMPQRDLLLPWLSALDNAALALRVRGVARSRARERGAGAVRGDGSRRLSGGASARALRRHAPARRLPAHAALREAGAVPGRAVRRSGRDHTRRTCRPGSTGALLREPRTVVLVTHDIEEAVVLADRVAVLSPQTRAGAGRGRRASCRARAAASIRRRSPCASARWRRWPRDGLHDDGTGRGAGFMSSRVRGALPALLFALALLALWETYVDAAGVDPLVLPAPHAMSRNCGTTPGCCGRTSLSPPARSCSVSRWRCSAGFAAAVAIHFSPLAAPRGLPARRRLPGGADRDRWRFRFASGGALASCPSCS